MTGTATIRRGTETYLSHFTRLRQELSGKEPAWLSRLRDESMARVMEAGFPDSGHEGWRDTNVTPIIRLQVEPAPALQRVAGLEDFLLQQAASQAVFLNGRFAPGLSTLDGLPQGVVVDSMQKILAREPERLQQHLLRPVLEDHVFSALNTAFLHDGALVQVPAGVVVEQPIHLLFFSTADEKPVMVHPRVLILAERGSQVTVVETYAGGGLVPTFTNAVTDLVLEDGAVMRYAKLGRDGAGAFHVGLTQASQRRDTHLSASSLCLGGDLVRNDLSVRLEAEGSECVLNGLSVTHGEQHVDNHTFVDHAGPRSSSRQLYKGILDDRSRTVFSGRVIVQPDAQKINARQTNKNLLLSQEAVANSTPQLEIHADDVQCRHGSTIGQLDEEMLFYLRSRGIDQVAARELLIHAFANEILDHLPLPELQPLVERTLFPEPGT